MPTWLGIGSQFVEAYIKHEPFDFASVNASIYADLDGSEPLLPDPRTTEDCLFLDVMVPKKTYDSSARNRKSTGGAPVLVWIHGGGFSYGDKTSYGNPAGLIRASGLTGYDEITVVALNYRVRYGPHQNISGSHVKCSLGLLDGWEVRRSKPTARPMLVCMINDLHWTGFKTISGSLAVIRHLLQ